jgi:predicted short-subunit dehydrogenase-like oxidoreductase (DUF2520 family)
MHRFKKIAIVGGGNLAWHLVRIMDNAGLDVTLLSRKPEGKRDWPVPVRAYEWLSKKKVDAVFLAVPDDAIYKVSHQLKKLLSSHVPVIHTSGATPITKIDDYFSSRGALWPIRSLRRGEEVADWRDIPLVYHANNSALTQVLGKFSSRVSDTAYHLDDKQRAQLHLAAVFSNNFVTWLYQISHELCTEKDIPFEALLPIIHNTALKQDGTAPGLRQTGAAARGDTATMHRHLKLLIGHPEYARLYRDMSGFIGRSSGL